MGKSKKFRDKLCVYCRVNVSTTADHVFPREMFQLGQRSMLPKVPSCADCNNDKSKLEHYLLSVLPFAATHPNAQKALSIDVPKRLNKNRKLHEKLKDEIAYKSLPAKCGGLEESLTIKMDPQILHDFIGFVGKGLMWYHWDKYLSLNCSCKIFTPSPLGIEYVDKLFKLSTKFRVNEALGDGIIRYKGAMSETDARITIWAVQLFGGMTVSDETLGYVFNNSYVAMVSGRPETIDKLKLE